MTIHSHPSPGGPALLFDPEPLIASVPGLLGFTPERSLVLLAFADGHRLSATLRLDLVLDRCGRPGGELRRQLDEVAPILAGYDITGVIAVAVDDRVDPADAAGRTRYLATFRAAARSFATLGGISAGFLVRELADGARWFTCWPLREGDAGGERSAPLGAPAAASGSLSDPLLSPVALHRAVYDGRAVLNRRADLAALLTPRRHCDEPDCRRREPVVPPAPPGRADARRVRLVLDTIAAQTHASLTCAQLNELAEAVSSVHARDVLIALGLTEWRGPAEQLWIRLARSLTGRAGAAAATLLALQRYLAGEGAFAAVALERALDCDHEYHLAGLLDQALQHGMRPAMLVEVVDYACTLAAELGVKLPDRTRTPAG